ncbi:hypothetical protein PUN28_006805 [Cardiocondyla obscurior]|uniref:Uncharacterized protein n=1 Tax=Cardiocondyla obscurior TaxID=286306 RepID=A0AAW2G268_9HYME
MSWTVKSFNLCAAIIDWKKFIGPLAEGHVSLPKVLLGITIEFKPLLTRGTRTCVRLVKSSTRFAWHQTATTSTALRLKTLVGPTQKLYLSLVLLNPADIEHCKMQECDQNFDIAHAKAQMATYLTECLRQP